MAYSRTIRLTNHRSGEETQQLVEFTDPEWATLLQFAAHADALVNTKFVRNGMPGHLSIKYEAGKGFWSESVLPPEEDLAAFLHRFRHLYLEREPASFSRACSILGRRVELPAFRALLAKQRRLFSGEARESMFRLMANGVELHTAAAFRDWINGFEYHGDSARRARIETTVGTMPFEATKALFIEFLKDMVEAIEAMRTMVEGFRAPSGFGFESRDINAN